MNFGAPAPPLPEGEQTLEIAAAVAQFGNRLPGIPYVSPAWPTRDHIIPWGLFWILYRQLPDLP